MVTLDNEGACVPRHSLLPRLRRSDGAFLSPGGAVKQPPDGLKFRLARHLDCCAVFEQLSRRPADGRVPGSGRGPSRKCSRPAPTSACEGKAEEICSL